MEQDNIVTEIEPWLLLENSVADTNLTPTINNMANASESDFEPIRMTLGWRIVWDILFGGSMFLSILGNSTLIWMIMGKAFRLMTVYYVYEHPL